jgi:chorismate mutase
MNILSKKKIIIAGPCSVETEEQFRAVADRLARGKADMIRGGIWKPRSNINSFEGVGETGLKWMANFRKDHKIPVATEVASAKHVELVLKYGIDVIWIGARTTINPLTVQEIADSLKGIKIPVMIKNPISPSLSLWAGAFDRFRKVGIEELAAIHRGFEIYQPGKYRFTPLWEIAVEFKSKYPDIPLICDPSHISGAKSLIYEVSQHALDLDFQGLMVEVHNDPDNALSDSSQQITVKEFSALLKRLRFRPERSKVSDLKTKIDHIREEIDQTDRDIVKMIEKRMLLVKKVSDYKTKAEMTAFQVERLQEIMRTRPQWLTTEDFDPRMIEEIFKVIHIEALNMQMKLQKGKKNND